LKTFDREAQVKQAIIVLLAVVPCFAQQAPIQDLNLLVGKKVIAQRAPLCQPGTYTVVLAYAGKQAEVISLKPFNAAHMSDAAMSRLTPELRAMMVDMQKAATILVKFEDGTQLDTCAPIGPSKLADYFELVPGQLLPPTTQATGTPPAIPASTELVSSASATSSLLTQATNTLSSEQVQLALSGKGKDHWVSIQDMGLMAAQGNQVPTITLYMPEAVLAMRAESARKQFTAYEPTEEDKRQSLMIVAQGYAGTTISEGCTSITRIVLLSDPSGGVVKEAYLSEPLDETWRNGFGATNQCQSLRAKFALDDVLKVKAAAPNGEFLVAVFSGSVNTKMYKIKKKHQSKLGLD
jgi:hypothetical protein